MTNQEKWDQRFLDLARLVSTWSKDPRTQVGAVIVDNNNRIVSVGYNGFPQFVNDTPERLHNRDIKLKMIVHAERNAIIFAQRDLSNCTLYTFPLMPCTQCAALIINAGITRCVSIESNHPGYQEDFKLTREIFKEANVELEIYGGYGIYKWNY